MRFIGELAWPHLFRNSDEDIRAGFDITPLAREILVASRSRKEAQRLGNMVCSPVGQDFVVSAARWADYAFPVVSLPGHTLAAALMCTEVRRVEIRAPWKAFVIELPVPLLSTRPSDDGPRFDLTHVLVHCCKRDIASIGYVDSWSFHAAGPQLALHSYNQMLDDLLNDKFAQSNDERNEAMWEGMTLDGPDDRTIRAIWRLIFGVCLFLDNRTDGEKAKYASPMKGPPATIGKPKYRDFMVGRDVVVSDDVRAGLKDFIAGKTIKFGCQWVVRGHWRSQPCGPGKLSRRATWIQPYWKGSDLLPVNMWAHVLREAERAKQ
jgi:hypothetical protein